MTPGRYLAILLVTALLGAPILLAARVAPIGCPIADRPGRFLAFCRNGAYQDFEHGAYALRLRPDAVAAAQRAQILFLGNSRVEIGFSTAATRNAFAEAGLSFYLLAFGYGESDRFAERLLRDLQLRPRAVIIDVDPFFTWQPGEPARFIEEHPVRAAIDYRAKAAAAALMQLACPTGPAPWPCGGSVAMLRDDADGFWSISGPGAENVLPFRSHNGKAPDPAPFIDSARHFLDELGLKPGCVVMTTVPTPQRPLDAATVRRIAEAIGAVWVEPELDGLATIDTSHLTRESAERWSAAFLTDAMPALRDCAG